MLSSCMFLFCPIYPRCKSFLCRMCNNRTIMFQRNNSAEDPDRAEKISQLKIMLKFVLYTVCFGYTTLSCTRSSFDTAGKQQ